MVEYNNKGCEDMGGVIFPVGDCLLSGHFIFLGSNVLSKILNQNAFMILMSFSWWNKVEDIALESTDLRINMFRIYYVTQGLKVVYIRILIYLKFLANIEPISNFLFNLNFFCNIIFLLKDCWIQ